MFPKLDRPLIIFDLETTGLDVSKDRIIQIAYIKVYEDGTEENETIMINPGIPIPPMVAELTGISDEDVAGCLSFKEVSSHLEEVFRGCDFAGFNSNHFDIPLLNEEFYRAGVQFDFHSCRLIDMQTIYHKMEPRNLAAAYKFYCGRNMEEDFTPHRADEDTAATWAVLRGQLDMYSPDNQEDESRQLPNDMDALARMSKTKNESIDFAGRIVWRTVTDSDGKPVVDSNGNEVKREAINFGKYKGWYVTDVFSRDTAYYQWIMRGDFTNDTKTVLTRIYMKWKQNKM